MEMIQFGMKNTLVSYCDKYFNYKGAAKGDDLTVKDVALAFGGYESAFLVDLVASYLLEMTGKKFIEAQYKGIYRDGRDMEFFQQNETHHEGGRGMGWNQ
eukprot:11296636-Ditylum_brightwellii.AAC.1